MRRYLRTLPGRMSPAVRDGSADWAYHLHDWGVFAPARVRRYLKDSGHVALAGSAP